MLNLAATNKYEVFLDAVIDDNEDELNVESWSPLAVSKTHTRLCTSTNIAHAASEILTRSFGPLLPVYANPREGKGQEEGEHEK